MQVAKKPDQSKETKKQILAARTMVEEVMRMDGNEAETRRRIERIMERLCGYEMHHLSREYAVSAQGATTEYCDFAIIPNDDGKRKPVVMVEIKRANVDLDIKHLKQVASYAINEGCEWILLTNAREWQLHHVSFGQPPVTKLVESWNLVSGDVNVLVDRFALISLKSIRKGNLQTLWQKANVLSESNLLQVIFSQECRNLIKRELKRSTGVAIADEELILAIRRMLNENAGSEVDSIKVKIASHSRRPVSKQPTLDKSLHPIEPDLEGHTITGEVDKVE